MTTLLKLGPKRGPPRPPIPLAAAGMATGRLSTAAGRAPFAIPPKLSAPTHPSACPRSVHSPTSSRSLWPLSSSGELSSDQRRSVPNCPMRGTPCVHPGVSRPGGGSATQFGDVARRTASPGGGAAARLKSSRLAADSGSSARSRVPNSASRRGIIGRWIQVCSSALRLRIEGSNPAAARWAVFPLR
jgi:hypothetical protein